MLEKYFLTQSGSHVPRSHELRSKILSLELIASILQNAGQVTFDLLTLYFTSNCKNTDTIVTLITFRI